MKLKIGKLKRLSDFFIDNFKIGIIIKTQVLRNRCFFKKGAKYAKVF